MWYIHRQISNIKDILPKGPYLPYVSIGGKGPFGRIPSILGWNKIANLICFSSRLAVVFTQFIEASCSVDDDNIVRTSPTGNAPTTSEWSTILLPTKVRLYKIFDGTYIPQVYSSGIMIIVWMSQRQ